VRQARHGAPLRSLADLGAGWSAAADARTQAARLAAEAAQRDAMRRRHETAAHDLFARTVGPVHPLRGHRRAEIVRPQPPPHPRQRELDERAAARAAMSDEVTLESLLLTDDGLSFRRAGIGTDVVARLRRGQWALQGQIDLHGLTRDEARDALAAFIRDSHRRGRRCLRVVHGKGNGSPGREPVLKAKVQRWLAQAAEVIAFAQASGPQGGAGALLVLLAGLGDARRGAPVAADEA
jgi:DNA-nicking Smr family endonuclease